MEKDVEARGAEGFDCVVEVACKEFVSEERGLYIGNNVCVLRDFGNIIDLTWWKGIGKCVVVRAL